MDSKRETRDEQKMMSKSKQRHIDHARMESGVLVAAPRALLSSPVWRHARHLYSLRTSAVRSLWPCLRLKVILGFCNHSVSTVRRGTSYV